MESRVNQITAMLLSAIAMPLARQHIPSMTRNALVLALLASVTSSCADDGQWGGRAEVALEQVSEVDGGVGGRPAFESPAPPSFDDSSDGDAGAEFVEADEPGPTAYELWRGDTEWECCTANVCRAIRCDEGLTPAMSPNGSTVCCVPDIGQCDGAQADDAGA